LEILEAYAEIIVALAEQSEFMDLSLGTEGGTSELFFRVQPRSGSTLAALVAAQMPAKHELLGKLPASAASSILMSGQLHAGDAAKPISDFAMKYAGKIFTSDATGKFAAMFAEVLAVQDGRFAMAMDVNMSNPLAPEFAMTSLVGTRLGANAARKALRDVIGALLAQSEKGKTQIMGMPFELSFQEKTFEVDGVAVDRYTSKLDIDGLNEEMRLAVGTMPMQDQLMHLAVFDNLMAMTSSPKSAELVKSVISAARGKSKNLVLAGRQAKALDRSKALKESLLMSIDITGLMPAEAPPIPFSWFALGMSADHGAMQFRFAMSK